MKADAGGESIWMHCDSHNLLVSLCLAAADLLSRRAPAHNTEFTEFWQLQHVAGQHCGRKKMMNTSSFKCYVQCTDVKKPKVVAFESLLKILAVGLWRSVELGKSRSCVI